MSQISISESSITIRRNREILFNSASFSAAKEIEDLYAFCIEGNKDHFQNVLHAKLPSKERQKYIGAKRKQKQGSPRSTALCA